MFSDVFCDCFLYPAIFEGIKLGTGKVWNIIQEKDRAGELTSTDTRLYKLIESVCRKFMKRCSNDTLYSCCEFLCNLWLNDKSFSYTAVQNALYKANYSCTMSTAKALCKSLNEEIYRSQELSNAAVLKHLEQILLLLQDQHKETVSRIPVAAPMGDNIDISKSSPIFFTNIGKEKTVYNLVREETQCRISINFEPIRIRPEIPAYGGVCYLLSPAINIMSKSKIQISIDFEDDHLSQITLELKKAGHKLPEDEKKYIIKNNGLARNDQIIDLNDCPFQIKEDLGEIVLATEVTDFRDCNKLSSAITIRRIAFMP